jgi:hypothetical protein
MYYEPDTVWGRTIQGDHEVATPRSGLSIVQRRVLRELGHPRKFASLAAHNRLEPPRLEHELIWLAERGLVAFQRPGAPQPRTAPRIHLPPLQAAEAVAPGHWKPPLPVYLLAMAVGCCAVLLLVT